MGFALAYKNEFEIEVQGTFIVAPGMDGKTEKVALRRRQYKSLYVAACRNPSSLQGQLLERALLIVQRKRATLEYEAAIRLREVVVGTVDHIFEGEPRAYDVETVAWIRYAFHRIEVLVEAMILETRVITLQVIEGILRRLCPLPPIC